MSFIVQVGCRLGEEVGYAIRFEDCTGPETVIKCVQTLFQHVIPDQSWPQVLCLSKVTLLIGFPAAAGLYLSAATQR